MRDLLRTLSVYDNGFTSRWAQQYINAGPINVRFAKKSEITTAAILAPEKCNY